MEKNTINSQLPLVSICIPCYNSERYLADTLDCILKQSYPNLEICIVDDHSTDTSEFIIQDYLINYPLKIKTEKATGRGAAAARNQAYNLSVGQYLVFFDADDIVDINFIQTQYDCINSNKNNVVVSLWARFQNYSDQYKIDPYIIYKKLDFKEWIIGYWTKVRHTTPPGRVMMSRDLLLKSGLWDESLSLNDDFQFFSRLFANANCIILNEQSVFRYRSGIGGLSSRTNSYKNQQSNLKSLNAGIGFALEKYNELTIKTACANMLQNFVYDCYPNYPELYEKAIIRIRELGGSNFPFPAGGYTKLLVQLLGWKLTKKMKLNLGKSS